MSRAIPAIATFLALVVLSCGGDDDAGPTSRPGGAGGIATPTATQEPGSEKPTPAPTPGPEDVSVANEPFSVETADGVILKGHIYSPDGPKRQALIIAAPAEQSLWAESTEAFTREGVAVFTFDPRGFGETAGEVDPAALADDIQLVMLFAKSREYPLLYVLAVGAEASGAALEKAAQREELSGLLTYGLEEAETAPKQLSLAPEAAWSGDDVLDDQSVREQVLELLLRGD